MNIIIVWILIIIVHELGHYISFRSLGFKPNIEFKWWGISIGSKVIQELKPFDYYLVSISGILWGAVILQIFIPTANNWLLYTIISGYDLLGIIEIFEIPRKYHKVSLKEYNLFKCKKFIIDNEVKA
jgi:hypothetical protein